jgi:hypothetical protein
MSAEEWRPWAPPFRYEVSSFGRIRVIYPDGAVSEKAGVVSSNGYRFFAIHTLVHRAVAQVFIGACPFGHEVNHIDGNKLNNAAGNLEYVTRKQNAEHASKSGLSPTGARNGAHTKPHRVPRGERHGSRTKPHCLARGDRNGSRVRPERLKRGEDVVASKLTESQIREIRQKFTGKHGDISALAREFGVTHTNIRAVVTRQTWRHVS